MSRDCLPQLRMNGMPRAPLQAALHVGVDAVVDGSLHVRWPFEARREGRHCCFCDRSFFSQSDTDLQSLKAHSRRLVAASGTVGTAPSVAQNSQAQVPQSCATVALAGMNLRKHRLLKTSCRLRSSFFLLLPLLALLRRLDSLQPTQEAMTQMADGPQLSRVRVAL